MKLLLILGIIIVSGNCAPQYNYQPQQSGAPSGGLIQQSSNLGLSNAIGSAISSGGLGLAAQQNLQSIRKPAPIITKDVYIHSAPEEPEEDLSRLANLNQLPDRKHYRIIFIKAPAQSNKAAALKLAQAQAKHEEKTIIYVLTKKTDAADIQEALKQVAPTQPPSKPEVFFIKYKTQEEAKHAQQQIQAQYDALGGTSSVSDEGIAPVHSVIGSLGNGGGLQQQQPQQQQQYQQQPYQQQQQQELQQTFGSPFAKQITSSYLPPARH